MLDMVQNYPRSQVMAVVADVLAKHGVAEPVPADADIARYGMTSIDMVELMLGIEAEFDLSIPPGEITLANFSSVGAIDALVTRLSQPA